MPLTSHLKDKQSPVRQFITESFPELALAGSQGAEGKAAAARFALDDIVALPTVVPIPVSVETAGRRRHATVAGQALDYLVRMSLPDFELEQTAAWVGLDMLRPWPNSHASRVHAHEMLRGVYAMAEQTMQEPNPAPDDLTRAAVILGWCESIYRAGRLMFMVSSTGVLIMRSQSPEELWAAVDENLLADLRQMMVPVTPVITGWADEIAAGARYEPNPMFEGSRAVGGADADLAVGDLLVEVKTREQVTRPWLREALLQLVGYVLLDLGDEHRIRRVGMLLPRQAHMQTWTVSDLLGDDADHSLPRLRQRFRGTLDEVDLFS